jgi:signal recognition particle subunit SRP68
VLGVLGEAEDVARRLLHDHEANASASLRSTRTAQSLSLAHQYIVYLLLSHRIRRDLLLVDSLAASATLPADPTLFKLPGSRVKVEEAVKNLAAVVKLYDTVLQSLNQVRSLAIVEEKEGVRRSAEGVEAYFHATKCYHLARLHCVHPTPSYASATALLTRAASLVAKARDTLGDSMDVDLQEEISKLSPADIEALGSKVAALELAAKRALFAQTVTKPVFFDSAFNYVDLPMEDLLDEAGTGLQKPAPVAAPAPVKQQKQQQPMAAPKPVPAKAAKAATKAPGLERTREATPTLDAHAPQDSPSSEAKKGWLGGWFGRG